jgi:hypothetical protein
LEEDDADAFFLSAGHLQFPFFGARRNIRVAETVAA